LFNFIDLNYKLVRTKKIIAFSIKLLIGVISFYIIYAKLAAIPHLKEQLLHVCSEPSIYMVITLVFLLMPINWGIESFKWKLITDRVEPVNYPTALKSVFSGICLGNVAPGRAMEFLAKIYYFKPENKPTITVLHFINGMFQMLITVVVGLIAITYKLTHNGQSASVIYVILIGGICLILFFCWAILNVSFIQQKLKFIKWFNKIGETEHVQFSKKLMLQLIVLSIVRYLVFTIQFYLILNALSPQLDIWWAFTSIAAYFMLTSIIPMISFIEPAIRAAIALFVFNQASDNSVTVVLTSTLVWMINVMIPSIIGYVIILKEKIDPKNLSFKSKHVD
jgi:hypothetical protein